MATMNMNLHSVTSCKIGPKVSPGGWQSIIITMKDGQEFEVTIYPARDDLGLMLPIQIEVED